MSDVIFIQDVQQQKYEKRRSSLDFFIKKNGGCGAGTPDEERTDQSCGEGKTVNKTLQWAISRILDITTGDFFGYVTLRFENGKLVRIEHQSSEKPPAEAA